MISWLQTHGIRFDDSMRKYELYLLKDINKPREMLQN